MKLLDFFNKHSGIDLNKRLDKEDIKKLTRADIEKLRRMKTASDFNMKVMQKKAMMGQKRSPKQSELPQISLYDSPVSLVEEIDKELLKIQGQSGGGFYKRELKRLRELV